MAQAGCGSQTHPAGKPAPALSNRLHMILPALVPQLQELNAGIRDVAVKVVPKLPAQPKVNSLHLSGAALESFDAAAAKLEDKHPELAAALAELVRKHSR